MKILFLSLRLLLGTTLFVFGLNGFMHFFPVPFTTNEAFEFQQALWNSNYLMHVVKGIEVLAGGLLLINRFVPAALLMLLPVSVNIFLVDVMLQPQFALVGTTVFVLNIALLLRHWQVYAPLVRFS